MKLFSTASVRSPAALVFCLSAAVLAACSSDPTGTSDGENRPVSPDGNSVDSGAPGSTPNATRPVEKTALEAELTAAGIDPKNPPTWEEFKERIEVARKVSAQGALRAAKPVMDLFVKSLGVECSECHSGENRAVPEERTRVVAAMWNNYVRGLKLTSGEPVFCDSCHGGKEDFLVRGAGLGAWMNAEFVTKLARTDGQRHGCATCHGQPFDGSILAGYRAGAASK